MRKFLSVSNILVLIGVFFLIMAFGPILKDEIWYRILQSKGQQFVIDDSSAQTDSVFARLLTSTPINISPVNKDFALVIEKIGVNAPVVADVPILNEAAYFEALKNGVAHAASSDYPSETGGNVYLFAHASINFWQAGSYATVFNLIRKLELGDKIHVFFREDAYVYEVVNKEYLKGWNTYPITRPVIEPTLTLQTCDPPGTTINRLVITAHLVKTIKTTEHKEAM